MSDLEKPADGYRPSRKSYGRLTLEGIGHGFEPGQFLFRNLDAVFTAGEVWGLKGPSGSGKSTLLSIIAGWEKPREGHVVRTGVTSTRWVPQNPVGVAQRSALDHVALPYIASGLSRRTAEGLARWLMADFALDGTVEKDFGMLSGGEAQRLMLDRAAAGSPDIILIDEPTAQLDRATAATVNGVLGALAKSGGVVVVASHDQQTLAACSEVLDLHPSVRRL